MKVSTTSIRTDKKLHNFYTELEKIHKQIPSFNFGQLMWYFNVWHEYTYHEDIFYLEETEFLEHYKKYIEIEIKAATT